jgi:hypothetical protein
LDSTRDAGPVEQSEPPQAERASSSAPAGAAGRVLALQRRIGNRAVMSLLRETDPRLTYTPAAKAEGTGLDAQTLPWKSPGDPAAGWNSEQILSKLTQVDESATTFTDEVRCGANSVLAVAITRGPLATEIFARGVMLEALGQSKNPSLAADRRQAGGEAYSLIWPAIRDVGNGTATYGDLSLIAHYAKVVMSKQPKAQTTGYEVGAMLGLIGGMVSSSEPIQDKKHLKMFVDNLKRGQSYILLVGTNVLGHDVKTRNLGQTNHFVVLGKDPDGKAFLYDPYPRVGTQLLRSGDPNLWTLFENAEGDWKASYIFARPKFD